MLGTGRQRTGQTGALFSGGGGGVAAPSGGGGGRCRVMPALSQEPGAGLEGTVREREGGSSKGNHATLAEVPVQEVGSWGGQGCEGG